MPEHLTPSDLRARVPDGSVVAVGGSGYSRKPMALLHALVDAGVRGLTVVSFLGSVDVELLLAAGAVTRLHTAGVALDGVGLAPLYRAARQQGTVDVVEWSEGSLHAALEATSRRLPSMPCGTAPASDVVRRNPHLAVVADHFDGRDVVLAQALPIDVALLHVPAAAPGGDLFISGDPGVDGTLARAADLVVASYDAPDKGPASAAAISRIWVHALVHVPGGAWPTGCHPAALADAGAARRWARAEDRTPDLLRVAA